MDNEAAVIAEVSTEPVSREEIIAQLEGLETPPPEKPKTPAVVAEEDDVATYLRKKTLQLKEGESLRRAQERERIAEQKIQEAERVKAEAQRESQALREAFKTNPVETFKKLNLASEEVLLALAEDGTPDKKQKNYLQSIEERINQLQKTLEESEAQRQAFAKEKEAEARRQAQDATHKEFCAKATEEAYPNARTLWDSDLELIAEAYRTVEEYWQSCKREGITPEQLQDEDILLALEKRAQKKLDKLRSKYSVAKPTDKKPRTLNGVAGSERRSTQKDISGLSEEEQHAALVAAAQEAMLQGS